MHILKGRRDFSGGEGSGGLPPLYPPCQPGIQLFRAQEVEDGGEDSGVPVDEDLWRRGAEDEFGKEKGPVPPPTRRPVSALALLTAPVSSFSVEMRPLRRLQGGDAEQVSKAGVCVCGAGGLLAHPILSPPAPQPPPQTCSPNNHLEKNESGIQVRVWREVLNLCEESERRRGWGGG